MKVVFISSPKTGSTSMYIAMNLIGLKTAPIKLWYGDKSWQNIVENTKSGKSIADKINNTKYYFYEDSPYNVNDYYKDIDSNVPNVKFIFVKRKSDEWANSLINYVIIRNSNKTNYLNSTYLYYACNKNRHELIKYYEETNREIFNYFKNKDNLLILDINDDDQVKWNKICNFLNISKIPSIKFPHRNTAIK